ncbi:MAG: DMP19 family protein, partial [Arthrobacter sp.]
MSNGQPTSNFPVVLTAESAAASNEDVVDANVTVVNAMYAELLDAPEIAPNALRSYYVDFYLTQALGGGFAQYVFTAPEREEIDAYVREGLEGMGAAAHLELFNRTATAFDALSDEDADSYLDGDVDGELDEDGGPAVGASEAVQELEELDGEFESLLETEDLTEHHHHL